MALKSDAAKSKFCCVAMASYLAALWLKLFMFKMGIIVVPHSVVKSKVLQTMPITH